MKSLDFRPSEMVEVMKDRDVWQLNLELLPTHPRGKARKKKETNRILETS